MSEVRSNSVSMRGKLFLQHARVCGHHCFETCMDLIPCRHRSDPAYQQRESWGAPLLMVPIPGTFLVVGSGGEWPDLR